MKTPEEILESNFYRPKETLQHYDNIITCMEDYHSQFKFYTAKQMEELREHAYQLGIQHERDTNPKHCLGTMDNNCDHDIEKLYNERGDYKGDYCKICKGVY